MFWVKFPHCITAVVNRSRASLGLSCYIVSRSEKLKVKSCRFRKHASTSIERATPESPVHRESVTQKSERENPSQELSRWSSAAVQMKMKMWSEVREKHTPSDQPPSASLLPSTDTHMTRATSGKTLQVNGYRGEITLRYVLLQVFWNVIFKYAI